MKLDALNTKISGQIITPNNEGYDVARATWELAISQKPRLIIVAENTNDLIEAVKFANANNLKVAVKNTGHGVSQPADDALLINVSKMNQVTIDAEEQTAWIEAGAIWQDVAQEAQQFGLAPPMGSSSSIGAIGYTLGGGMGWLTRKYGFAVDNVLAYHVILADGSHVAASKSENSDLFWGLSGGGGSLGIVAKMKIKLLPVTEVFAGTLMYPQEYATEVYYRYREWLKELDDSWTTSISIMNFPPFPPFPDFLQGNSFVLVRACYCGHSEEGMQKIQSWLDWKEPIVNEFQLMPYKDSDIISNDPKEPVPSAATNILIKDFSDEVIDVLIDRVFPKNGPSPLLLAELHQVGGASSKMVHDNIAFSHHDTSFILKLLGMIPNSEVAAAFTELTDDIIRQLSPYAKEGVYLNFLVGKEKWEKSKESLSPESYLRLMELKKTYDPNNLFAFNMQPLPFKRT